MQEAADLADQTFTGQPSRARAFQAPPWDDGNLWQWQAWRNLFPFDTIVASGTLGVAGVAATAGRSSTPALDFGARLLQRLALLDLTRTVLRVNLNSGINKFTALF